MTLKSNVLRICLLLFVIVFSLASCYKKKDTIVVINVRDTSTSDVVVGAAVQLVYDTVGNPNPALIDVTATTDPQGQAVFNFNDYYKSGQAGFAVLDVLVNGVLTRVIQVEEENTTEETVYI